MATSSTDRSFQHTLLCVFEDERARLAVEFNGKVMLRIHVAVLLSEIMFLNREGIG
jgi:hypothetical protein